MRARNATPTSEKLGGKGGLVGGWLCLLLTRAEYYLELIRQVLLIIMCARAADSEHELDTLARDKVWPPHKAALPPALVSAHHFCELTPCCALTATSNESARKNLPSPGPKTEFLFREDQ
jgi:hypothetical protein